MSAARGLFTPGDGGGEFTGGIGSMAPVTIGGPEIELSTRVGEMKALQRDVARVFQHGMTHGIQRVGPASSLDLAREVIGAGIPLEAYPALFNLYLAAFSIGILIADRAPKG